jgi:hypothetical protein
MSRSSLAEPDPSPPPRAHREPSQRSGAAPVRANPFQRTATPRAKLTASREAVSTALRQAIEAAGVSWLEAADAVDLDERMVRMWADPARERDIPLARILCLPPDVAKPLLEWALARVEGATTAPQSVDPVRQVLHLSATAGEVAGLALQAQAGVWDKRLTIKTLRRLATEANRLALWLAQQPG